jgi:glycerate kinase
LSFLRPSSFTPASIICWDDLRTARVLMPPTATATASTAVHAAQAIAPTAGGSAPGRRTRWPRNPTADRLRRRAGRPLGERRTLRVSGPLTAEVDADWVRRHPPPRTAYIRRCRPAGWRCWAVRRPCTPRWRRTQGSRTAHRAAAAAAMHRGRVGRSAATDDGAPLLGPPARARVFAAEGADPDTVIARSGG